MFVSGFLSFLSQEASALQLDWSIDFESYYVHQINGLRLDLDVPTFNRESNGAQFSLSAIGILELTSWLELNVTLDMGELFLGRRVRGSQKQGVLLLNQIQLNWTEAEQSEFSAAEQECITRARAQNVPTFECQNVSSLWMESLFLRELYTRIEIPKATWIRLDVGFKEQTIGKGHVFEDYALGLFVDVRLQERNRSSAYPFHVRFSLFLPDISFSQEAKLSPVFHIDAAYVHSAHNQLRVFFTYMPDGDRMAAKALLPIWQNGIAARISRVLNQQPDSSIAAFCSHPLTEQTVQRMYQEPSQGSSLADVYNTVCDVLPKSEGHHFWFGVEGQMKIQNWSLEGVAVLYASSFSMVLPSISSSELRILDAGMSQKPFQGLGFSGELKATYTWPHVATISTFFLLSSGDHLDENRGRYFAYLGISPQTNHTELFFSGGVGAFSYQQGLGLQSVQGKGLLATGFEATFVRKRQMEWKFSGVLFWSIVPSTFSLHTETQTGSFYGAEVNFLASFILTKWLRFTLKSDLFFPGDFFAATHPPPIVFRSIVGLNLSFSSL